MMLTPHIWVPDRMLIPPSPPAERRNRWRRAVLNELRTYTGRVLLPGSLEFEREIACLGTWVFNPGAAAIRREVTTGPAGGGQTQLASDVVFGYELEETTGTRADVLGVNGLDPKSTPGGTTGKVGTSLNCNINWPSDYDNGTGKCVYHASATAYDFGNGGSGTSWTFIGWIYPVNLAGTTSLMGKFTRQIDGSDRYDWRLIASTTLFTLGVTWTDATSTGVSASTYGAPSLNTWQWVLMYYDFPGQTIGISVNNGTANTQGIISSKITAQTADQGFCIGGKYNAVTGFVEWPMNGRFDEVYGWKRLLTAPEKASLYNSGNGAAWGTW